MTETISPTPPDADLGSALDIANISLHSTLLPIAAQYPNNIQITDAAGACLKLCEMLIETIQDNEALDQNIKLSMSKELGEVSKAAQYLQNFDSEEASKHAQNLTAVVSDLSIALGLDKGKITEYSQTTNIVSGERSNHYRKLLDYSVAATRDKEFFSNLPKKFSPETSRGEKLVGELYFNCGVIQSVCDALDKSVISFSETVREHVFKTLIEIGYLAECLSDAFVEEYFTHMKLVEFKSLCEKLQNSTTYQPLTPSLITQLNQEIKPMRQILVRHTGEEAEKQKAVVDNYNQIIDIQKRDLDGLKGISHPIIWVTSILIAVRFGLLPIWDATWIGMLSLLGFIAPVSILLWRDLELPGKEITIEYPEQADFWVTRTHLHDRMAETRKDNIEKFANAIERRRRDRKLSEKLWFIVMPVAIALNILSSACGWI